LVHGNRNRFESEQDEIRSAFRQAINMTPKELERWLDPEESKGVGWTREEGEDSIGHKSGRRIVQLERKKVAELSDDGLTRICKG